MSHFSARSYNLTESEYNYLLPAVKKNLLCSNGKHYLIADSDQLEDLLSRLKGFYDYWNELPNMLAYKCFITRNLEPFRNEMKNT